MLVLYAGAAPGTHTNYLAEMFPHLDWILVDPAKFDSHQVINKDGSYKIQIINDFFTTEMAKSFSTGKRRKPDLFICDIRSMDQEMSDDEKEERVKIDMEEQKKWVTIMKPRASMLKFRLPYCPPPGTTEYLSGTIFLPVWGGRTTSETRLCVTDKDIEKPNLFYDHKWYEDLMYHHNSISRTTYYPNNINDKSTGLDHCYDCVSEILILSNYLYKVKGIIDENELKIKIATLSKELSTKISTSGRTLVFNEFQSNFDNIH